MTDSGVTEDITFLLNCPICRCMMSTPRMFPCGHSLCTSCHKHYDKSLESSNVNNNILLYHCPVCRKQTLLPWKFRPINYALNDIIRTHPEFDSSTIEEEDSSISSIDDTTVDVDAVATRENFNQALVMYEKIAPLVIAAAHKGILSVKIDDDEFVNDCGKCLNQLSDLLITRNNVYMIEINIENKLMIYITENGYNVKRRFKRSSDGGVDTESTLEFIRTTEEFTNRLNRNLRSRLTPPWGTFE